MRYIIIIGLLLFTSCNVAKKVFRHKDKSIIKIQKDSTGSEKTHIDTSRKITIRTISNTDIIRQGADIKGRGTTDLDQAKIAARKGKALVVPLLDSLGRVVGSLSTVFDSANNQLNQVANLHSPPEQYHHSEEKQGNNEQKGITDKEKHAAVKSDENEQHNNQEMTKDVKRSPAWIKIAMPIAGAIVILLAVFNRGKIWNWLKKKIKK